MLAVIDASKSLLDLFLVRLVTESDAIDLMVHLQLVLVRFVFGQETEQPLVLALEAEDHRAGDLCHFDRASNATHFVFAHKFFD